MRNLCKDWRLNGIFDKKLSYGVQVFAPPPQALQKKRTTSHALPPNRYLKGSAEVTLYFIGQSECCLMFTSINIKTLKGLIES